MSTEPTVVLVDDEEMVVTALHSFLQLETPYNILTFTSPREALRAMEEQDVQVVVADYMMPDLDGISFLTRVRETQPQASRILLTGYADKENAIRAINEAGLFHYLEKPWDNDHLKLVVRNGVERAHLIGQLDEQMSALEGANAELADIRQRLMKAFL
ncbi:MAG: response regulator [Acidobacteriota bacterium]|nr:MAG: response regulator [Acidobacteriota bacterium]